MTSKTVISISLILLCAMPLAAQYNWQLLAQSPQNGQKQDDAFFLNPNLGWSVNGSGRIYKTTDGGATWTKLIEQPGTYFRCIGFIDSLHGFAGNIGTGYFPNVSDNTPLYRTIDGGANWQAVTTIAGPQPTGLCAIQVVTPQVLVAGGRVGGPAHFLKSTDGGASWTSQSLAPQLAMLTDLYFSSPDTGFAFGGTNANIQLSRCKILRTTDGGQNWTPVYESGRPFEIVWKAHFPSAATGYATVLSYAPNTLERFVAKTTDGGLNWTELPLVDNGAKAFGIGFLNDNTGWVGCDNSIYETTDGGLSWTPKNIGQYVNKIRVMPEAVYGIGVRIYKMVPQLSTTTTAGQAEPRLNAWPNPAYDSVNVSFYLEKPGKITLQIFDPQGRLLYKTTEQSYPAGKNSEVLPTGTMPSGMYLLVVSNGRQTLGQTKLLVQQKP
ncbi:MAG: T9SS type A sorting domain-containing protein [Saprospiraceae bacterium]|nr:T9SS type A sorting domain-containing protein [Saprospiraceae bacterium]